jgi:hypothetical protein
MKLIDEEPWRWMLFEDGDDLYLDVLCSQSAVDYRFPVLLDAQEVSEFRESGRDALNRLAQEIHYSAPGVIGNNSRYRGRKVSEAIDTRIREATSKEIQNAQQDAP